VELIETSRVVEVRVLVQWHRANMAKAAKRRQFHLNTNYYISYRMLLTQIIFLFMDQIKELILLQ
jgi:hypothetical protein